MYCTWKKDLARTQLVFYMAGYPNLSELWKERACHPKLHVLPFWKLSVSFLRVHCGVYLIQNQCDLVHIIFDQMCLIILYITKHIRYHVIYLEPSHDFHVWSSTLQNKTEMPTKTRCHQSVPGMYICEVWKSIVSLCDPLQVLKSL